MYEGKKFSGPATVLINVTVLKLLFNVTNSNKTKEVTYAIQMNIRITLWVFGVSILIPDTFTKETSALAVSKLAPVGRCVVINRFLPALFR